MRLARALVLAGLALLLAATPLRAAHPYFDNAALDELFVELREAGSAAAADEVAQEIWDIWLSPAPKKLSNAMDRAAVAVADSDFEKALSELDAIVRDYPDYAEGFNQRATVRYLQGNYDAALADIERTLAIEPRHFGARAGRVQIYLKQGRRDDARREMVAALAIHPYLSERAMFPELVPDIIQV